MSSKASAADPAGRGRFSRLHLAAVAVVVAAIAACGFYLWRLADSQQAQRAAARAQLEQRALQLADAVAGQTAILARLVDFAVQHLRDDYVQGDAKAFEGIVRRVMEGFPGDAVLQIGIIGADGYLAYSNLSSGQRIYLGDREHFRVHAENDRDELFISKPVFGRVSRSWSIQFSRPIRRDGRFLGVVVLSVAPAYLAQMLAVADLGRDDTISLFRVDGAFLSRSRDLDSAMGKSVPPDRPFVVPGAAPRGTYRTTAVLDQVLRTYAWRRLEDVPLAVTVGLGETAALAPVEEAIHRAQLRNGSGVATVLVLAFGLAFLLVGISAHQRILAQSERRYRSFFDQNTSVKLLIDPEDGRIVDANGAAADFYGYSRERLRRMRMAEINGLSPEDVQREAERARAEGRQYCQLPHRLASGEIRQVEVYSGPMEMVGRPLVFSIIHDVTVRHQLEAKLRDSEALHRTLFEAMAEGVVVVDGEGRITAWNGAALAILGTDGQGLAELRVKAIDADGIPVPEDDYPSRRAARGERLEHELCGIERADGSRRWLTVSSRALDGDGPGGPRAVISFSDITRLVEAEEGLRLAQSVFEAAGEGILVTDGDNRIVAVNPAFSRITGYPAQEVLGRNPSLLSAPGRQDAVFYRTMWQRLLQDGQWEGEITNRRKDGQFYVEWLRISAIRDGRGRARRFVGLFSDVTERKRREEVVWQQANFDALTGLANRQLLTDRLGRAMAQAARKQTRVAVLFIDLDRFKPVNDDYGHAAGDDLLRQVARRLEHSLREEDTVARLGGDEFIVVLPDLGSSEAPGRAAEKIVAVLSEPFRIGEHFVEISCSIGIAVFPRDAEQPDALISRADAAMYRAKEAGRATWSMA